MRFFLFPVIAMLVLSGCGKQQPEEEKTSVDAPPSAMGTAPQVVVPQETPSTAPPVVTALPETLSEPATAARPDALVLAQQSGCLACHNVEKKVVGPAWKDVSARYKNYAQARVRLIAKVKAGGKGNWTEVTGGLAMPPYSPRVSDQNIETLVDFVLSLAH